MIELITLLPPYLSSTAGNVKSYNPDFSIITAFLPRSRSLMKMSRELSSKKSAHPCPNYKSKHLDYHITDMTSYQSLDLSAIFIGIALPLF
jgi:hypothetical protein